MKSNKSFLQLPFQYEIDKLLNNLSFVCDEDWVNHPNVQAYEGSWQITALTSVNGKTQDIVALENVEYQNTPLLEKTKYIQTILSTFKTKVESVRFMKLGANSIIKEHCDKGSCFEQGYARLHIPITTNDETYFILNGNKHEMITGNCYYIDAHNSHSVINDGESDRVHLLIDCHVNDWLKEYFLKGGFREPVYKYGSKGITDDNVEEMIFSLKELGSEISLEMAKKLENIKDLNKSLELGNLGISHIKSFHSRKMKEIQGDRRKNPLLDQMDYFVLDGLDIPIAKAVEYLYTKEPDFKALEEWILLKHKGAICSKKIDMINDAVSDFVENGQQDYPLDTVISDPVFSPEEMEFWSENGYIVLKNAADKKDCKELESAIWKYLNLSPNEPEKWKAVEDGFWLKEFEHPLLDSNRSSQRIYKAFAQLWGTDKLFLSTDRLSFNPPLKEEDLSYGPNKIHWDVSLAHPMPFDIFGLLYLNDVKEEQGAFQCMPGFNKKLDTWLKDLGEKDNPREEILDDKYKSAIRKIAAEAGDFIICNQTTPHGSSINTSDYPRFVHYMNMYPANRTINPVWK